MTAETDISSLSMLVRIDRSFGYRINEMVSMTPSEHLIREAVPSPFARRFNRISPNPFYVTCHIEDIMNFLILFPQTLPFLPVDQQHPSDSQP